MRTGREFIFDDLEIYELKSLVENHLMMWFQNKKECLFNSDLDLDFVEQKIKQYEIILKELKRYENI